jgi:hypothetical protein
VFFCGVYKRLPAPAVCRIVTFSDYYKIFCSTDHKSAARRESVHARAKLCASAFNTRPYMADAAKVTATLAVTFTAGVITGWLLNSYTRKVKESVGLCCVFACFCCGVFSSVFAPQTKALSPSAVRPTERGHAPPLPAWPAAGKAAAAQSRRRRANRAGGAAPATALARSGLFGV